MRVFVAINFPADVRREIWDATAELRRRAYPVTWVDRERIHLTVKFLGEVDGDRLPGIETSIGEAVRGRRAFSLPMEGVGVFPNLRQPRVVWVGCAAVPALELLHDDVERRMRDLGFPLEGRAFRPHITVGRARRTADGSSFATLPGALEDIDFRHESWVTSVDVMESRLGPGGPQYACRFRGALED